MHPQPTPADPDSSLLARLGRWRRLAWLVLLVERVWPVIVPPLCIAGLFVAAALFDILPMLPAWLHLAVLVVTVAVIVGLLARGVWRLRLPDSEAAARRLERDSHWPHRPLDALMDRPVGGADQPLTQALWRAHRARVVAAIDAVRLSLPQSDMAARDPWGLRAAVLLLLVIAATVGHADWHRRLDDAVTLRLRGLGLAPDMVELWITPPAYTRKAPILLKADGSGAAEETNDRPAVAVPSGSTILSVLSGGWGGAHLVIDGHSLDFQRQGDGSQRIEAELRDGSRLSVRQSGLTVAAWPIEVVPDAVPSIAWEGDPEPGEQGRLRLSFKASDDYGVAKAWLEVRRMGAPPGEGGLTVALPMPTGQAGETVVSGWFDLTAHPWAGLPVTMQPVVQDAAGQQGQGEPVTVTLPERTFSNPVAAAVVDARRKVTEDLAAVPEAQSLLDRIGSDPALFNDDLKAFLMLRAARHAMASDRFDLAEVQELMWNGALRIEEGDLASAQRSLEDARQALEQAVEEGASAAELQRLLDQFQQALERYMQALAERGGDQQAQPMTGGGETVTDDELRDMVQTMRDMVQSGSRDALRQMVQDMSRLLDGLQAGAGRQGEGTAGQGLKELRDLVRRQQEMLDQSHQRSQPAEDGLSRPGQGGGKNRAGRDGDGDKAAQAQDAMRKSLDGIVGKLGPSAGAHAAESLGQAGSAMGEAAGELRNGNWLGAADAQAQALDLMRQAAREALEQMSGGVMSRDPLGRPMRGGGTADDGATKIPDRSEVQRSRDLLEEIRRRAGDYQRPEPERDYLRRLLRQF